MINKYEIEYCVLTLDARGERMRRFDHSAAMNHVHASVWQGLRGSKWKIKAEHYPNVNYGMMGNCLSHLMLLEQQKHKLGWTMVLEDDVTLAEGYQDQLQEALAAMPADRDLYFAGWFPYTYAPQEYPYQQSAINELWSEVNVFHGNYGYLVRNANIQKILDALPELWHNLDWMLYGAQKEGKLSCAFLTRPVIIHDYAFDSLVRSGE